MEIDSSRSTRSGHALAVRSNVMSTDPRSRKLVTAVLAGIGITAGAAGIANAVTAPRSTSSTQPAATAPAAVGTTINADATDATETADPTETADSPGAADTGTDATDAGDSTYAASVTAPQGTGNESNDNGALAHLAKITTADATKAALAAVPGTASAATLENENGNVVYSVIITTAKGAVDVKVDAGNGKILAQDTGTEDGNGSDNG